MIITVTCVECGQEFERYASKERYRKEQGHGGPYCSQKCLADSRRDDDTVTLNCIGCGEEFERRRRLEEKSRREGRKAGPFCSKPCTSRYYAQKNKPWEARQAPLIDRFMPKWEYDRGCWVWNSALDGKGYGNIKGEGESNVRAHHISFEAFYGEEVRDGHELHHTCERKSCVNPLHLKEVTPAEHSQIHARQ